MQDKNQIDETRSILTTKYYLPLKSKKNKNFKQSQKITFQNLQDYKTEYGYNFKPKDDNIDIDTKSIQRIKSIRTQNSIMQSKYHPKTYLTVVETSFFSPDKNMYTNFLTAVTLTGNKTKTKHFANNKQGRTYKTIVDKTETDNESFKRKRNNSTQNSIQQTDYLAVFITTVTSPKNLLLNKTSTKTTDLKNKQRHNFTTKVSNNTANESQSKSSNKSSNSVQESDYFDTVKSLESENYTSLFQIARRLSNPFPDFNDPEFQNILNEYRAKVQRPLNVNGDPRQFNQLNIINKMQEYQKMARFNGAGNNGPGQYIQNNPGRNNLYQNHRGFTYPRNIYSPMTRPRQTSKYRGYRFPVWQQGFVGGRQGQNFGPDRPSEQVKETKKYDIWQAYKMPHVTEPTPPMYYQDIKPGETIDFFATAPHGDDTSPALPEAAMNITTTTPLLTTVFTRFTTILTTTTRRLRTTPYRPNFDEDCDYTAYYCMKAYNTGELCARTLYNKYATFKNYCMVDFVNCMERYETWVIIHMGECFEIKLVSQYVHYPYMDDYFLDQYYLNENM